MGSLRGLRLAAGETRGLRAAGGGITGGGVLLTAAVGGPQRPSRRGGPGGRMRGRPLASGSHPLSSHLKLVP